jgi:hypothetical protein
MFEKEDSLELIVFSKKDADAMLSRTQKNQLNQMLKKMGYDTLDWGKNDDRHVADNQR